MGIIETIIFIELAFIVLLILGCYLLKIYYVHSKTRVIHITKDIEALFNNFFNLSPPFDKSYFSKKWLKFSILLPIVTKFDRLNKENWRKSIRILFFNEIIFPLTHKAVLSKKVIDRYHVVQTYNLCYNYENEEIIYNLTKDKTPLISLSALRTILANATPAMLSTTVNNIIDYASTLPLFSQAMYLASFEHPNANIVDIITQRLASEDAPLKKAFCFKILLHAPMSKNFYAIAAESITTTNLDLELAAIRLLAHSHVNEALVLLEHLLSHPLWQIRALALSCLIDLKASINNENLYRLLNDPVNEVRIQAKKALDHLGKQELHAVSQDLQIDSLNYESEDYSIMLEEANK